MNSRGFNKIVLHTGMLLIVFLVGSCSKQAYYFNWNSVIVDQATRQPVPFTNIYAKAIYQDNIDHSSYAIYRLISDSNGKIQCSVSKAYQLNINIETRRYQTYHQTFKPSKNNLPDTIFLTRSKSKNNLYLSVDRTDFNLNAPFISQKTIYPDHSRKNEITTSFKGFDFILNQCSAESFDLGLNIKSLNQFNNIELTSTEKGGIFPVFENEITGSFFLEMENAPQQGYHRNYQLTGEEAGFFIRCRDGKHYAKVIFDNQLYQLRFNQKQDSIVELGLRFNYIIQKDSINRMYFPAVSILEQLKEQELTSILYPVKIQ